MTLGGSRLAIDGYHWHVLYVGTFEPHMLAWSLYTADWSCKSFDRVPPKTWASIFLFENFSEACFEAQGRKESLERNPGLYLLNLFFGLFFRVCLLFSDSCFLSRMPGVFASCFPWYVKGMHRAPRPIAFRLRGQDPLMILALGDLQWARGPFCSS